MGSEDSKNVVHYDSAERRMQQGGETLEGEESGPVITAGIEGEAGEEEIFFSLNH